MPSIALRLALVCLLFSIAAPERAEAKWKYRVTPHLKNSSLLYFNDIPNTDSFRSQFHGEINAVYRWKNWFKLVLQPVGDYDPTARKAPRPQLFNPSDAVDNNEQLYGDLREGYLQLRFRPFTLTLGNQIISWGVSDGFSPIDVVNPRRYVSPLNSDKIGTPAATLGVIQGDFDLDLIFIPVQRRSVMPGEDSRWLPRSFYVSRSLEGFQLRLPKNLQYYYLKHEELDDALDSNFGARLRGQLGGFDLAAMYFEGAANSPSMFLRLGGSIERAATTSQEGILAVDPEVRLMPVFYKRRVYGGTAVYTLGEFILKAEGAVTQQISTATNRALPGDYHETTFSIEHDFPAGDGKLTAVAQGTYAKYKTDLENGTTSLSRIFESAAALGLRYAPDELWSFVMTALMDMKHKGGVFVLNADYKVRDNLGVNLTASFIDGPDLAPLGTYRKNDLGALSVRYDF